jgi:hypothetical protein
MWQAWDGWIPARDAVVTRTPERDVLHHCILPTGKPLTLGKTLAGEPFTIDVGALAGVNLIAGAQDIEASQLATSLIRGLMAQGRPCLGFDIPRPSGIVSALLGSAREGENQLPHLVRLRAGDDFKLDVRQCGPAVLLGLLTQFGLPQLPALYFVSHAAHRLASTPAEEVSQAAPFLGIEELLQLAYDLEAIGDKVLLGAILSCLRLLKQAGVLASTPAETTSFQGHYEAIRHGGAVIVDLSALNQASRGGTVQALFDLLSTWHVAEENEGAAHVPCLILEEPRLYLEPPAMREILLRANALGMPCFIVTTRLTGIELALPRRLDNLFLLRQSDPDDIRTLANSGLLDHETVTTLSCRLGSRQGLLVGKATRQFPVPFAIEVAGDHPGDLHALAPPVTAEAQRDLPTSSSPGVPVSPSQPPPGGSGSEATLPLFPEDAVPPPALSQALPHGRREQDSATPAPMLSLELIAAKWDYILKRVGRRRRILETILSTARPVHLEGHTLRLGFPPQSRFQQELMASPEYCGLLEEELAHLLGVSVEVTATFHPMPETPRR